MDTLTSESGMPSARSRWLFPITLVAGLAVLVFGPLAGGLFILFSLVGRQRVDALSVTTIGLSVAALCVGLGGALSWAGYQGLRGEVSRPFRPGIKWLWVCLAGLGLALLFGQLFVSFDLLATVAFPLFHVLAIALPAIVILVLVGQGLKNSVPASTQRQVIGQMAFGAFLATVVSFSLEVVVAIMGLIVVAVVIALMPGGLAQLTELQAMLADPARLQDPQALAHWLLRPWILLSIALMLVVIAPIIEELAKSIGVPLLSLWTGRKPSPAQGWLWGIAAGAGFAVFEGLFNGAAGLPLWVGIAVLRIGATTMHVVTAGLAGLGWARTLASRRAWSILGSYLASVTLHAVWNGLTVMIVISSLGVVAQPEDPIRMVGAGIGIVVGLIGLVLLAITIMGLAVFITLRVREQ